MIAVTEFTYVRKTDVAVAISKHAKWWLERGNIAQHNRWRRLWNKVAEDAEQSYIEEEGK